MISGMEKGQLKKNSQWVTPKWQIFKKKVSRAEGGGYFFLKNLSRGGHKLTIFLKLSWNTSPILWHRLFYVIFVILIKYKSYEPLYEVSPSHWAAPCCVWVTLPPPPWTRQYSDTLPHPVWITRTGIQRPSPPGWNSVTWVLPSPAESVGQLETFPTLQFHNSIYELLYTNYYLHTNKRDNIKYIVPEGKYILFCPTNIYLWNNIRDG